MTAVKLDSAFIGKKFGCNDSLSLQEVFCRPKTLGLGCYHGPA